MKAGCAEKKKKKKKKKKKDAATIFIPDLIFYSATGAGLFYAARSDDRLPAPVMRTLRIPRGLHATFYMHSARTWDVPPLT